MHNYVPYHLSHLYPDGVFDIPRHTIPLFLNMAKESSPGYHVKLWAEHIGPIHDVFKDRFRQKHFPIHRSILNFSHIDDDEAHSVRSELIQELAEVGFTIQIAPADRLEVSIDGKKYVLSDHSLGRTATWVWIDQKNTQFFEFGQEHDLVKAIAEHFRKYHDYRN